MRAETPGPACLQPSLPFADTNRVANNRLEYLTPNDWTLLNAKARRRSFKLGEEIIQEGSFGDSIFVIREGTASVELAGSSSRSIVATLGRDDICGDMAFLERGKTTAAVVAKDVGVEVDEITADDLRDLFEAFPRLAFRFYRSLAVVLARRLHDTSRELAREMALRDRGTTG
jgi:extracellular factor (EF) 3-hydroxypalmitic acid methyl ester biosynthesis protein